MMAGTDLTPERPTQNSVETMFIQYIQLFQNIEAEVMRMVEHSDQPFAEQKTPAERLSWLRHTFEGTNLDIQRDLVEMLGHAEGSNPKRSHSPSGEDNDRAAKKPRVSTKSKKPRASTMTKKSGASAKKSPEKPVNQTETHEARIAADTAAQKRRDLALARLGEKLQGVTWKDRNDAFTVESEFALDKMIGHIRQHRKSAEDRVVSKLAAGHGATSAIIHCIEEMVSKLKSDITYLGAYCKYDRDAQVLISQLLTSSAQSSSSSSSLSTIRNIDQLTAQYRILDTTSTIAIVQKSLCLSMVWIMLDALYVALFTVPNEDDSEMCNWQNRMIPLESNLTLKFCSLTDSFKKEKKYPAEVF